MTVTPTTDPTQLLVASRTYVWLAPTGTVAPVDAVVALDPAWKCVGLTVPDSLQFSTNPNFQQVQSAQSDYPTLTFQTDEAATVTVALQQWSGRNFQSVYGGGSVTAVTPATTPPTFKFVPPKVGTRTEKSCIIEVISGSKNYRFVVPRVFQMEGVQLDLTKTKESHLPLKMGVMGSDATDPYYLLTNDPAFDPAVA